MQYCEYDPNLLKGPLFHNVTDLVASLFFSAHAEVLTSSGNGQFKKAYLASGITVQDIQKVDLNMDGKPDLVLLPGTPANFVEIVWGQ